MGVHPWKLGTREENNASLAIVQEALEFDHVLFVGECGLDKVSAADYDEQKRVFTAQATMAEEFGMPLIIHSVRAYNEIIEIHKRLLPTVPWILHGYTGSWEMTVQLTGKGFLFSFGKHLLNPKTKAYESFKGLPAAEIFLETDDYNGPISDIYEVASGIRDIPVPELKEVIWKNFNRLENVSL